MYASVSLLFSLFFSTLMFTVVGRDVSYVQHCPCVSFYFWGAERGSSMDISFFNSLPFWALSFYLFLGVPMAQKDFIFIILFTISGFSGIFFFIPPEIGIRILYFYSQILASLFFYFSPNIWIDENNRREEFLVL